MLSPDLIANLELTNEEISFFNELLKQASHLEGKFSLNRLSSGALNVDYNGNYIGKLCLYKTPDRFAVIKKGAKRASKIFDSNEAALNYIAEKGDNYTIDTRKGEPCGYMQYLKDLYNPQEVTNPTLENCINTIPKWIKYIKYCEDDMLQEMRGVLGLKSSDTSPTPPVPSFCPMCGNKIEGTPNFCRTCGHKLKS